MNKKGYSTDVDYETALDDSLIDPDFRTASEGTVSSQEYNESVHSLSEDEMNDTFDDMQNFLKEQTLGHNTDTDENSSLSSLSRDDSNLENPVPEMKTLDFKLPMQPVKQLLKDDSNLLNPVPDLKIQQPVKQGKLQSSNRNKFENVISPVRLYIKNSPTAPLVKNCAARFVRKEYFMQNTWDKAVVTPQRNKPFKELKKVVYKPSSLTREAFEERKVIIPGNIKDLIKEVTVVKHLARTKSHSETTMTEMLENLELSRIHEDKENMSIHVTKSGLNYK